MKKLDKTMLLLLMIIMLSFSVATTVLAKGKTYVFSMNGNMQEKGKFENMVDMVLPVFYTNKLYNSDVKYDLFINYYNTNKSKTEKQVLDGIKKTFSGSHKSDLGVFIYNGHGQGEGWVLYKSGLALSEKKSVSYKNLAKTLAKTGCGKILVIINACQSGFFIEKGIGTLTSAEKKKFYVITSCAKDEYSYKDSSKGGFSFYMSSLSKALTFNPGPGNGKGYLRCDLDGDKKVRFAELFTCSKKIFKDDNEAVNFKKVGRFTQNPQWYSLNGGDVLFAYDVPTIKMNTRSQTLKKGKTTNLTVRKTVYNGSVTWKSSNSSVATVANGKVYAKKNGSATITVSFSYAGVTYSDSCKVTVK